MFTWYNNLTIVWLVCFSVAFALPLFIVSYYLLRLRLRRNALRAKIIELHLEPDYLRVFHFSDYQATRGEGAPAIRDRFIQVFDRQFRGENSFLHYLLPMALSLVSSIVFAFVIFDTVALGAKYTFIDNRIILFSLVGAMLYAYPTYIDRYASFSLNPPVLFELVGKLWLSTMIGVVLASLFASTLQSVAAFIGGLLPMPALDLIKKRIFKQQTKEEDKRAQAMLEILHDDRNLLSQLEYIGIRTVLELAYENPLKVFVGTNLNLVVCIDLVDQANLRLYVPDGEARRNLNTLGIRTAIDVMTQLCEYLPAREKKNGHREWRFLGADEKLPEFLKVPMQSIATAFKVGSIENLRNIIQMMTDNPQLKYISDLWSMLDGSVDKATATSRTPIRRDQAEVVHEHEPHNGK